MNFWEGAEIKASIESTMLNCCYYSFFNLDFSALMPISLSYRTRFNLPESRNTIINAFEYVYISMLSMYIYMVFVVSFIITVLADIHRAHIICQALR